MLIESLVYFARIDIFASTNDHVGFSIHDVIETVIVSVGDIAGMKPSVAKSLLVCLGILVIAFQNVLAAQYDLAQLPLATSLSASSTIFISFPIGIPHEPGRRRVSGGLKVERHVDSESP